jgi:hypothetical protein
MDSFACDEIHACTVGPCTSAVQAFVQPTWNIANVLLVLNAVSSCWTAWPHRSAILVESSGQCLESCLRYMYYLFAC